MQHEDDDVLVLTERVNNNQLGCGHIVAICLVIFFLGIFASSIR